MTRKCERLVYNFEYHVKSHCKAVNFCKCCFLLIKIKYDEIKKIKNLKGAEENVNRASQLISI